MRNSAFAHRLLTLSPSLFVVACSVAAGSSRAQPVATDDQILAEFEQKYLAHLKAIEQAGFQDLRQIEQEQQALLDKLGQTNDALQAEKDRNAALEARLQALLGSPATQPAGTQPVQPATSVADPEWRYVDLPPRVVNALGMIQSGEVELAALPPGTQRFVMQLPDLAAPDGVTPIVVDQDHSATRFVVDDALGNRREIATLSVHEDRAVWRWHALSPAHLAEALNHLDRRLKRAQFAAVREGVVLQRYHPRPAELSLSVKLGVPQHVVRHDWGAVALRMESTPAGWAVLKTEPDHLAWLSDDRHVAVFATGDTFVVRPGHGLSDRLRMIDQQKLAWQRDLDRGARGETDARIDERQVRDELARLDEEAGKLEALRSQLSADASGRRGPVRFSMLDPETGLMLATVTLLQEGR